MKFENMEKALYYGMTRWGGWYVNFIHNFTTYGMTADTQQELLEKCKKENLSLVGAKREDFK